MLLLFSFLFHVSQKPIIYNLILEHLCKISTFTVDKEEELQKIIVTCTIPNLRSVITMWREIKFLVKISLFLQVVT